MKTVVMVGGVITVNNKLLILRRSSDRKHFPDLWEIPGGKVEDGEDPNDAIVREVKEETGLNCSVISPYHVWSDIYNNYGIDEHIVQVDYIMKLNSNINNIQLSKEHDSFTIIEKGEIPDSNISEKIKITIIKAFDYIIDSSVSA